MRSSRIALLTLLLLVAGCRTGPNYVVRDPTYADPSVAPREGSAELSLVAETDVGEQLAASDVVFNGEIVEVGRSPGVGSGVAMTTQAVVYRVTRVLKGKLESDRVVVHHVLAGGATADPRQPSRLNPAVFREGARLLVWAKRVDAGPEWPGQTQLVNPWETPGPLRSAGHAATQVRMALR